MNEVFTNAVGIRMTVDDVGISFQINDTIAEFPYGSIEGKLKIGILGNVNVVGSGISKVFVAFNEDKGRLKSAIAYAEKMNAQAMPCKPREYSTYVKSEDAIEEFRGVGNTKITFTEEGIRKTMADGSQDFVKYHDILTIKCTALGLEATGANGFKLFHPLSSGDLKKRAQEMVNFVQLQKTLNPRSEYRIKCKVCGHVYCYTDRDVAQNEQNKKMSNMHTFASTVSAFAGTTYNMYEQQKQAEAIDGKIVDYSRCPKCNSTDIISISEEEWQNINTQSKEYNVTAVSAADEIKKFKDLLDCGIITQEEFEAKKKQLLGLQ